MNLNLKIKKKIIYPNGEVKYILNTGIEISEIDTIKLIREQVISNAMLSRTEKNKEYIKGKPGSGIIVERLSKKRKQIKNLNISDLPYKYDSPEVKNFKNSNNNCFYSREIYLELVKWKNDTLNHYVLLLQGPRQVGKTSLLKQFGKNEFKKVIYSDLSKKTKGNLITIYNDLINSYSFKSTDEDRRLFLLNLFKIYDNDFEDSINTLIIIDEVQESSDIYNLMRDCRRCLNSRVIFTGSYIGLTQESTEFKVAAGDFTTLTLYSFSFNEFLNALGLYTGYKKIKSVEKENLTEEEILLCSKIEEAYEIYLQIGGYPEVVKTYVQTQDLNACKVVIKNLIYFFYNESRRYFADIVDNDTFNLILTLTAQDLIKKSKNLNTIENVVVENLNLITLKSYNRNEKISCLRWLLNCNILGSCSVLNDLSNSTSISKNRYFFTDLGFLNYFLEELGFLPDSDKWGMQAENFVYLYFKTLINNNDYRKYFHSSSFYSFEDKHNNLEIDFVLLSRLNEKIAIEVKATKGQTKSGNLMLEKGKVDKLIKFIKKFGSVEDNKIIIPIFLINLILNFL